MLESLFNKVAGLQASNFIKKRPQQRYFLVNITKSLRTPILKNICERLLLHFWKVFCENILQIITKQREHLMKQKWSLPVAQISKIKKKCFHLGETTAIGKGFIRKSRKYFAAHQYQNFRTLNICNEAK